MWESNFKNCQTRWQLLANAAKGASIVCNQIDVDASRFQETPVDFLGLPFTRDGVTTVQPVRSAEKFTSVK